MEKIYSNIPKEIIEIIKTLEKGGFEAYIVGGCVRDLLINRKPSDWDITTNAKPEEIIALFEETFYENVYGTVGVVNKETEDETLKVIEITPYRLEASYSDSRRPDSVTFSNKIDDDLKRRDFTVNAIAIHLHNIEGGEMSGHIVDLFAGQDDLKNKIIKTVGNPDDRFSEDGLRILRAIRIASSIDFEIESNTEKSIALNAPILDKIARERIRDEFVKMIMSERPMLALQYCQKFGLLKYIIPELENTIGMEQKGEHIYDVWEHSLRALQHSADKDFPLEIRLAVLLHDIGKPKSRRAGKTKWTFYGHEVVGERMVKKILENLRFSSKTIEKVVKLVRWHMFFSDTEQITLSAVRRLISKVGQENIWDLMNVRVCDRIGMGRPKEEPYRLRKYQAMIEEALRDPISVGMLKIDGKKLMEITREKPGPKIGYVLHALLEDVLEDPKLNTEEYLSKKSLELIKLSEKELREMGESGKEKKEKVNEVEIKKLRTKRKVQ